MKDNQFIPPPPTHTPSPQRQSLHSLCSQIKFHDNKKKRLLFTTIIDSVLRYKNITRLDSHTQTRTHAHWTQTQYNLKQVGEGGGVL